MKHGLILKYLSESKQNKTLVQVKENHQYFGGQKGYFAFMGGPDHDVVVLRKDSWHENATSWTAMCVGIEDIAIPLAQKVIEKKPNFQCSKCNHMPSERMPYLGKTPCKIYPCDCPCHDAADSGPALLEILQHCKAIVDEHVVRGAVTSAEAIDVIHSYLNLVRLTGGKP